MALLTSCYVQLSPPKKRLKHKLPGRPQLIGLVFLDIDCAAV
jgi:hypothetical protein